MLQAGLAAEERRAASDPGGPQRDEGDSAHCELRFWRSWLHEPSIRLPRRPASSSLGVHRGLIIYKYGP